MNIIVMKQQRVIQDLLKITILSPKLDERGFLVEQMKERENIIGGSLINYLELIMSEA